MDKDMTLLEYVTTYDIITKDMTLQEFFNISLMDTPITVPPTRKERKEVFELVNDNRELDAIRGIHRKLTGIQPSNKEHHANRIEDKILKQQDNDPNYWD